MSKTINNRTTKAVNHICQRSKCFSFYVLLDNVHYRNPRLCRVPFVGHSAKKALPRAALGKVRLSATSLFTECWTLSTGELSAKPCLPSVKHSAKVALGKGPSAAVPKLTVVSLCREPTPSATYWALGKRLFAECLL